MTETIISRRTVSDEVVQVLNTVDVDRQQIQDCVTAADAGVGLCSKSADGCGPKILGATHL